MSNLGCLTYLIQRPNEIADAFSLREPLSGREVSHAALRVPVLCAGYRLHLSSSLPWLLAGVFAILLLVLLVAEVLRLRRIRKSDRQSEDSELRQQLIQSEMRALRSQMNPHFIFNAINSIQHYVLINEKELANKYLVKFSKLMRNILELSKEEKISLGDELETARLYMEIEALRFNHAFTFNVSCEEGIDQGALLLPPLLIQPFIENAIWHGLLLKEGSKNLAITVRRIGDAFEVAVDDNGIGRAAAGRYRNEELRRRSFGMDITKERLEVLRKAHGLDISVSVVDKVENDRPAGTRVLILIKPSKKPL